MGYALYFQQRQVLEWVDMGARLFFLALLVLPSWAWSAVAAKILLQNSPLAGYQYHEAKAVWGRLKVGDALVLVREPSNSHDENAVRVEWQGHKLGYVPRRENHAVARFMDRGVAVEAVISRLKKSRDPWRRVRFDVYLPLGAQ
jgi:hypothetical protein